MPTYLIMLLLVVQAFWPSCLVLTEGNLCDKVHGRYTIIQQRGRLLHGCVNI